jgi:hypothetical protein
MIAPQAKGKRLRMQESIEITRFIFTYKLSTRYPVDSREAQMIALKYEWHRTSDLHILDLQGGGLRFGIL